MSSWKTEPTHGSYEHPSQSSEGKPIQTEHENEHEEQTSPPNDGLPLIWRLTFLAMAATMLACLGMQLSLLAIGKSLNMMNPYDWSFGQIIAITVWTPPIMEYAYRKSGKSVFFGFLCPQNSQCEAT